MLWVIEGTMLVGLVAGAFVALELWVRLEELCGDLRDRRAGDKAVKEPKPVARFVEMRRPRTTFDVDRERMDVPGAGKAKKIG